MEVYNFTVDDGSGGDYYVDYSVFRTADSGCIATGFMSAPKQGDRIMAEVQQNLAHAAQLLAVTVTHNFVAETPASERLAQRTDGYTYAGENQVGLPVYIKEFKP